MKKLFIVIALIFLLAFSANALTVEELSKLSPQQRNELLDSYKAEKVIDSNLGYLEKSVQIGQALAVALKETASGLSIEVNKFIETPVGKMTFWLILYHIVFKELIFKGIAVLICCGWIILSIIGWNIFFIPKKIKKKTEEGVKVSYIQKYNFQNNDARGTAAIILTVSTVLPIILMLRNL